jgi:hypothetical protein
MKIYQRSRARLLLACSAGAISAFSTVAHAQCTPDPTVTSIQTDCPGTDTNGLVVTTVSPVSVPVGGIVTNSGAAAISVAVPYLQTGKVAILVAGTVDGAGNTGIAATAGPSYTYYYDANVGITVAQGGLVTGRTAITAGVMSGTSSNSVQVALDNSGTIRATSGPALATGSGGNFLSITNRAGGSIGGISGIVTTLLNEGVIDGGSNSAIASGSNTMLFGSATSITNSGSILSAGAERLFRVLRITGTISPIRGRSRTVAPARPLPAHMGRSRIPQGA